jgi:hypothetical protein
MRSTLVGTYMGEQAGAYSWWQEWDWRPFARLAAWLTLGSAWAASNGYFSADILYRAARELILGWLLSFGLLTYVQLLLATAAIRFTLAVDDFAFGLADRLVKGRFGHLTFSSGFLAAFALEIGIILLSGRILTGLLK